MPSPILKAKAELLAYAQQIAPINDEPTAENSEQFQRELKALVLKFGRLVDAMLADYSESIAEIEHLDSFEASLSDLFGEIAFPADDDPAFGAGYSHAEHLSLLGFTQGDFR